MRVLGIDTATRFVGVALLDTAHSGWWLQVASLGEQRGEVLTAVVERALDENGWIPEHLDGIAVAAGPGSYTGLRVGLAVAKTLAWAWEVPLAVVDTLQAQALGAAWAAPLVVAALDAGHGEVFAGVFRVGLSRTAEEGTASAARVLSPPAGPLTLHAVLEPQPIAIRELARVLAQQHEAWGGGCVAACGDGCRRHRPSLEAVPGLCWVWVPEEAELTRPSAVARLGAERLAAGEADDPVTVEARYLKATEAERRWLRKS